MQEDTTTEHQEYNEEDNLDQRWMRLPMPSKPTNLGQYITELMAKHQHSNRSLAAAAGVSESAIRNLLKFGADRDTKDPDARTLTLVAKALEIDPIRLFRLAGYIPPEPAAPSERADYLAQIFDELPTEKQDAVLGVLEAMADKKTQKSALQAMRADPKHPLAGIDLSLPNLSRFLANQLIVKCELSEPSQVNSISDDATVLQYRWGDLPKDTQERIKALIRHKISLDYDPTMVDDDWRG